ncbi:hypothetical protein A5N78_06375 [Prescottella equi]|uniref:hypothetical protein n=1 Tax=Rhodococcus hoagii TaxID=43767 RepID=UPI000A110DD7|nr:hypothetical protein [Prescottella equi]ORL90867.1 hypothetical protein A5N78_06375 [Prescottella equi]ORM22755.1 hypothetical protein A5N70_00840 [Prescottella equi]
MFGFTRQTPATPVDVIAPANAWPDEIAAELAEDRDAAILATADDGRAGLDRAQRHQREAWLAAIVLGIVLGGIAWAGVTDTITGPFLAS